ncbi:MAG: 4-hydroxythreonine-4-phosphate dehydrogenase PdxA [Deltaproteobacteria bacterium]|nr:4-hydroxythreonine-4-phosphate dehydrogenase PdxA [Deltaproteobacteria bacterium]
MKPKIGITIGCPCGIGPEIVEKAIADSRVMDICETVVFGSLSSSASKCGSISIQAVESAVRAAMAGEVRAIVTAPINKSHWKAAGSPFPGHTEYLAHLTGAKSVAMCFASPKLTVSLVTTHLPLADVPKAITVERICEVARLTCATTGHRTIAPSHQRTRIAVCALNPHAGENGVFGKEEIEIILPAIKKLQSEGLNISGPYPADTVFLQAIGGKFGAVIAMYHDQALAPIKTLDFKYTVNVTLGLPFIRTSPDHGTAEDIAGKGIADHENMVEAIKLAVKLTKESVIPVKTGIQIVQKGSPLSRG